MQLRPLRYFVTLSEVLHFRKAAERLHITQPTLSQQIKTLERDLKAELFERAGHKVQLTQAGKIFREHALRALKEIETASNEIAETDGVLRGSLAIGTYQSFNSYLLPPLLGHFHEMYPGIHVVTRQMPKRELEQCIVDGTLDFGVAYVPTITDKVEADELFDESYALVVGKRHALYRSTEVRISALDKHPLVLQTSEFPLRQLLDDWFRAANIEPRISIENNSIDGILETVRCTKLATIIASRKPSVIRGLHCIDLHPAITRTAALFWRRGGYRSKAALTMAALIRNAYGQSRSSHRQNESVEPIRHRLMPRNIDESLMPLRRSSS